ncbi:HAD family hydrolase [Streptomyces sp. NPDC005805]|uniref:HAD family hydrolase n=1 Tax=Streptomyces sp. NPDC005805 TaxID=3157068 RepID=UPI0033F7676F
MTRAALFDVDGTLADTNHLHVVAWWEAFRQAGHRIPMHSVHRAVGLGSMDLIGHLLGEDRDTDQDAVIAAAHRTVYGQWLDRLPALASAGQLLRTLAARDWRVVLVTSASGPELDALRRAIDADDAVHGTTSSDDVSAGKPAPEPVLQGLELAGAEPRSAVFVGDTVWDMQAAARAGVPAVGLLCGGIPRVDLERAGARAVYADPDHLLSGLDTSPLG